MQTTQRHEARRDLVDWSQPVIVDFLHVLYARRLGESHHSLRVLRLSHARMWRFLLADDIEKTVEARREVIGLARLAGLKTAAVDEIDQAMLAELMDVVVARFLRTPTQARHYGQILLGVASGLARFGVVAA